MKVRLSVILPTRDRADLLARALRSLTLQTYPTSKFEVLVVDNGSKDHTAQVIGEYQSKLPNLRGVSALEPGLHSGRHAGMREAEGEVLVFTDDDIEALPSWLAAVDAAFEGREVVMVGGNNLPMFVERPPAWLRRMWEKSKVGRGPKAISALSILESSSDRTVEISPFLVWGCNFSIRSDVLRAAGGFHPDAMPSDLIRFRGDGETHVSRYVAEAGLKCIFHPGASVFHKVTPDRMTFEYFRQRGFRQGVSDSFTALRNRRRLNVFAYGGVLRRAASWGLRQVLWMEADREVEFAKAQLRSGYLEGYAYHQKCYREDSEVRDWVHRPTYF